MVCRCRDIAWELELTLNGGGYYGNALRVAKYVLGVTPDERALLDRYLAGTQTPDDRFSLQELAVKVYHSGAPEVEAGDGIERKPAISPVTFDVAKNIWGDADVNLADDATRAAFFAVWKMAINEFEQQNRQP